jgi:hypothetical protein
MQTAAGLPAKGRSVTRDENEDNTDINNTVGRVLRGGSFNYNALLARSAGRVRNAPTLRYFNVGFRPARTLSDYRDKKDNDNAPVGVAGVLELADGEVIVGWAWDPKKPDTPVKVDIYDGDTKLATVTANDFRKDLADAQIGNGKHGFSYPTPARLKNGKAHAIHVKVSGTKKEVDGSPQEFKAPKP